MRIFHDIGEAEDGWAGGSPIVVTIGNFDGVHRGHRVIIDTAVAQARQLGGKAVALTFRPHPQIALRPEAHVPLLLTYDEKLEALAGTGLDAVVEQPFSRAFSVTPPEQFFTDSLVRGLNARAVVVGYDFAFGKGRSGHLERLGALCSAAGVGLTVVPPQRFDGEIASSSRIRAHLAAGEVDAAARLLGRPFFYRGIVSKGEGRGRKIGFPTANLAPSAGKLELPRGVYATFAVCSRPDGGPSEPPVPSVTNVGVRPTFTAPGEKGEPATLVECHLLDRTIDLYGVTLEVRFVKRLRDERKFSGIDELKAQIGRDVEAARPLLA